MRHWDGRARCGVVYLDHPHGLPTLPLQDLSRSQGMVCTTVWDTYDGERGRLYWG